ncbi:MAG: SBBP repeat-containing protein, partial [Chitinophagales bacterium]|nr:SBBP repeat-containing protein [Chitinophagales bacterium]
MKSRYNINRLQNNLRIMMNFQKVRSFSLFTIMLLLGIGAMAQENKEFDKELLNKYENQLHFIENKGQWDANDMFRAQGFATTVQIRKNGFMLSIADQEKLIESYKLTDEVEEADAKHLPRPNKSVQIPQHAWMVNFVGMSTDMKIKSEYQDRGKFNYFIGSDKSKWANNVSSYEEIWYKNVYKNIDARLYASEDLSLEYDMVVKPGGNVADIQLQYEGLNGMYINKEGKLIIKTIFGETAYSEPIAYQIKEGKRVNIQCQYELSKENILGFKIGDYDKSQTLLIDPIALRWAVYVAFASTTGSGHNHGIEVDADQNLYVVGRLNSTNFPTTSGVFQTTATGTGNTHGFVSKLDQPAGINGVGSFIWSTYVSGTTGSDNPYTIKLDPSRNVYITGVTASTDFPTTAGSLKPAYAGGGNTSFLTKINSTGTALVYSTYIGVTGTNSNFVYINNAGEAYLAGSTPTGYTTTAGAHQTTYGGGALDGFWSKINAAGSAYLYSTYYGGATRDEFTCVRPNGANSIALIGTTTSANGANIIATTGAFQTTLSGTGTNGMVVVFDITTNTRTWGTYINPNGGANTMSLTCGQVDNAGNVYIGGFTSGASAAAITAGVYDATYNGGANDFYLGKLNAAGSAMLAGTYVGGSGNEVNLMGLNIDDFGKVYTFGYSTSSSPSLTTTPFALQAANAGGQDAIFLKINADYTTMEYLSYWGGSNDETDPIGFDGLKFSQCKAYTAMTTQSANDPMTRNGFQITKTSGTIQEPAVTVWSNPPDLTVDTIVGNETICFGLPTTDIIGSPSAFLLSDISRNGVITAQNVGPLTYTWQKSTDGINFTNIAGATGQNLTSAEIGILSQTTYFKRNIGQDFCVGGTIVTKNVDVVPIPSIPFGVNNPSLVCKSDTIKLTAEGLVPGNNFVWTGPNAYSVTNPNPTQFILNGQVINEGTYLVSQTNPAGCQSVPDTFFVDIIDCPPVAIDDVDNGNVPGVDAVVNLLVNDLLFNGSPATPGTTTVDLDPATPGVQTTLTVPGEGVYTYDPATGDLTFNPDAGFTTDPTPITYILTETATGLSDPATVTITYDEVAPVAT